MIGSPAYPTTPERRAEISGGAYDRAFRPGGLLRQTHAILATGGFADVSRQIKAPTQIIHGSSDPLVQAACGRRCSEVIPNAKFTLIEGMGHDFPDALMPRWAELIATNAGRA